MSFQDWDDKEIPITLRLKSSKLSRFLEPSTVKVNSSSMFSAQISCLASSVASPRIFVLAILAFERFWRNMSGIGSGSWRSDKWGITVGLRFYGIGCEGGLFFFGWRDGDLLIRSGITQGWFVEGYELVIWFEGGFWFVVRGVVYWWGLWLGLSFLAGWTLSFLPYSISPSMVRTAFFWDLGLLNLIKAYRNWGFDFWIGGMTILVIKPNFLSIPSMSDGRVSMGRWEMKIVYVQGHRLQWEGWVSLFPSSYFDPVLMILILKMVFLLLKFTHRGGFSLSLSLGFSL